MHAKKQLILWVLSVLNNESDENHPLTQVKIAEIISKVYPCDRKTVCRNIKFLQAMGYPIKKTNKGFYMDCRLFSVDEVKFVQDAILNAPGKSEFEKEMLMDRVMEVLTTAYRR